MMVLKLDSSVSISCGVAEYLVRKCNCTWFFYERLRGSCISIKQVRVFVLREMQRQS